MAKVAEAKLVANFANGVVFVFEQVCGFFHSCCLVIIVYAIAKNLPEQFFHFGFTHAPKFSKVRQAGWLA